MSLKEQIQSDYITAYKAKEEIQVSVLRMTRAAITIKEKDGQGEMNDEAVISLIKSLAKQRRDAAEQYRQGDREDLAFKEEAELEVLTAYLPAQVDDDTIRTVVKEVVAQTGASSMKDMGRVMKESLAKLGAGADGKTVSNIVKEVLQAG